ncbi:NAD-dependent epimerase/dehydratase family protein [bacterium]|nr:NAD-dependent epimerase/dehydratase family protein [bacterium]
MEYPWGFSSEKELEDFMSTPRPETVDLMKRLDGDIMILGIGGKMGPTLGSMTVKAVREAGVSRTVYGVSRFSDKNLISALEDRGISCIPCDLLNPDDVNKLPRIKNIIYMAGRKFGLKGTDYLYWAMNTIAPAYTARHFSDSAIVVFSTGSIYDLRPVESNGPAETDTFLSIGEYANSCLGRERIFEYYSRENGTKILQLRLNYAIDLRYGVLYEIGRQVHEGIPVDLGMGYANVIWQGDANNYAVRCLELADSPPRILNVTGDKIRIRDVASRFGKHMNREPVFTGTEAPTAFLSDNSAMKKLLGEPPTSLDLMIGWIADWIMKGGQSLGKPTHFQTRDGQFLD